MTLTGAQIDGVLEQQFAPAPRAHRILQVSVGFAYPWSASGGLDKVNPALITIDGVMVDPLSTYRVTMNSFLADGGDSFTVLVSGTNPLGGAVDPDAFEATSQLTRPSRPAR